jgi:type I restriction enzyme, S subunit
MSSEWKKDSIKVFADSFAGGTPSRTRSDYYNGDIPWISSGEVNKPHIDKTIEKITQLGLDNSSAKWIPVNSILVAMYGATAGQVSKNLIKATSNQAVLALVPKKNLIDGDFLYYQVKKNKDSILYLAQGSGQPNLSKDLVDNFKIKVPKELPTQRRIARILSTTDAVIEKTQAAIAKYKAIKQGMLHDLFTRGIITEPTSYKDKTGKVVELRRNQLRPKYEDAPELYKPSKLGWIPKEWEVERIGKLYRFNQGIQCSVEKQKFFQEINDVRFIRIIDLTSPTEPIRFIADPGTQYHIKEDDLFMVRYGVPGLVGYGCEGVIANNLFRLINTGGLEVSNSFYRQYLTSINETLLSLSGSSTMPAINFVVLNKLFVIYPKYGEQEEIDKRINSIDNKIQTEQNYLHKLQQIKAGLMADLLSGKKEVLVDEETVN